MPPVRTIIPPPKPMKTERTHEENQERAYIAASRRSDRSLEARVESARRASEIHKRRTGRSLRVTEQDVVNEEMYEEEDEDLPMQYRRLAAHLNSGSSGFNRRLAAYLTNHIAMRSALGQAISNANQQFPNPTDFSSVRPQPWDQSSPQLNFSGTNLPLQMSHQSPSTYRHSPYPPFDQKSTPIVAAQSPLSGDKPQSAAPKSERRASEPLLADQPTTSGRPPGSPVKSSSASPDFRTSTSSVKKEDNADPDLATSRPHPHLFPQQNWSTSPSVSMGPLTTAMPRETLMYPGCGFDTNNPFGNQFWGADGKGSMPSYDLRQQGMDSSSSLHPSFRGMNQTLAPDMSGPDAGQYNWPEDMGSPYSAASATFDFDQSYGYDFTNEVATSDNGGGGGGGSGHATPTGDIGWASFIDQSSWE